MTNNTKDHNDQRKLDNTQNLDRQLREARHSPTYQSVQKRKKHSCDKCIGCLAVRELRIKSRLHVAIPNEALPLLADESKRFREVATQLIGALRAKDHKQTAELQRDLEDLYEVRRSTMRVVTTHVKCPQRGCGTWTEMLPGTSKRCPACKVLIPRRDLAAWAMMHGSMELRAKGAAMIPVIELPEDQPELELSDDEVLDQILSSLDE